MESQVSSPGFHGEETHATHAEEKNGLPFGSWRVQDSPHPRHITAVCEGHFLEHKLNTRSQIIQYANNYKIKYKDLHRLPSTWGKQQIPYMNQYTNCITPATVGVPSLLQTKGVDNRWGPFEGKQDLLLWWPLGRTIPAKRNPSKIYATLDKHDPCDS